MTFSILSITSTAPKENPTPDIRKEKQAVELVTKREDKERSTNSESIFQDLHLMR
jgi:hypothetical protein